MPAGTAINTTKRKFHKILDSISNASSTSLNTKSSHDKYHNASSTTTLPAATVDPPAKKPRIEQQRPTSAYLPPSTRILLTPNLRAAAAATTAKQQPVPTPTIMNEERKPPNFAPWDRAQFLERLKTYRHVEKWMGKPERINEVQWAKRGWSCVGKERVACVGGCAKELVIKLESTREERQETAAAAEETLADGENEKRPADEEEDEDEWREKAQEQLVEKYAEMIVTSHDGGCLWRRKGCDDTIQRLPLAHHKTAIDDLRQRYHSLVAISSDLPPAPSIPSTLDLPSISQLLTPLLQTPQSNTPSTPTPTPTATEQPTPLNPTALALSLFGWTHAEQSPIPGGLATCPACFRRLGLWLFKPTPTTSTSSPTSSSSSSTLTRLDVLTEHRTYCPWISGPSQNGNRTSSSPVDGLAGWEMLLRAVNARRESGDKDDLRRSGSGRDISTTINASEGGGGGSGEGKGDKDAASEVVSVVESESGTTMTTATTTTTKNKEEDAKVRDEKDKERWAKLKRLKQAFHVKRRNNNSNNNNGKGGGGGGGGGGDVEKGKGKGTTA